MNQSAEQLKWFYRSCLIIVMAALSYVVLKPSYNLAHRVPHNTLRWLGANYDQLLWIEHNIDLALHAVGGFVITALAVLSKLPFIGRSAVRVLILVSVLCVAAEVIQYKIGRGAQSLDLLLGILGGFMAYLAFSRTN